MKSGRLFFVLIGAFSCAKSADKSATRAPSEAPQQRVLREFSQTGFARVGDWTIATQRNKLTDSVEMISAMLTGAAGNSGLPSMLNVDCQAHVLSIVVHPPDGLDLYEPVTWRLDSLPVEKEPWGTRGSESNVRDKDVPGFIARLATARRLRVQAKPATAFAEFPLDSIDVAAAPVMAACSDSSRAKSPTQ